MIDTNRKGRYLRYLIDGGDVTELPKPFSDIECYLYGLCVKKSEGGDKGPKGDAGVGVVSITLTKGGDGAITGGTWQDTAGGSHNITIA